MKTLVVEDEKIIQYLLEVFLKEYGPCVVTDNVKDALDIFKNAFNMNEPFDLVTLDIMLPDGNGQNILKGIRKIEKSKKILGLSGVKTIIISALGDKDNILGAFKEQCDGYIVKPVDKEKITAQLQELELI